MALMGLFGDKRTILPLNATAELKYLIGTTEFGLHKRFNSKKGAL